MKRFFTSVFILGMILTSVNCFAQLKVASNGYVGINNSSPTNQLDVNGDVRISGHNIEFLGDYSDFEFDMSFGDPNFLPASNNYGLVGNYNKQLYAVYASKVYGNQVLLTSDKRKKENIKSLENVMAKITKIAGKKYDFKIDYLDSIKNEKKREKLIEDSKNHVGFIAQDLKNIIPEAVSYDEKNDAYYVDYIAIIPYLVEAIKEQQHTIDEQNQRLDDIENNCCNSSSILKSVSIGSVSQTDSGDSAAKLYQNAPNPFSTQTTIKFEIPSSVGNAQLYICNMTGTLLKTIPINQRGSGNVTVTGNELKAGMYLYSLVDDGKIIDTKQMLLTE